MGGVLGNGSRSSGGSTRRPPAAAPTEVDGEARGPDGEIPGAAAPASGRAAGEPAASPRAAAPSVSLVRRAGGVLGRSGGRWLSWHRRAAIRSIMAALAAVALAAMMGLGAFVLSGISNASQASADARAIELQRRWAQEIDMVHDAIRADVYRGLVTGGVVGTDDVDRHVTSLRLASGRLRDAGWSPARGEARELSRSMESYAAEAARIADTVRVDPEAADAAMPGFEESFRALETDIAALTDGLTADAEQAGAQAGREVDRATSSVRVAVVVAVMVILVIAMITARSLLVRVRQVAEVAGRMADGDLQARAAGGGGAEMDHLAGALNALAAGFEQTLHLLRTEGAAQSFAARTHAALDMALTEERACDAVIRAVDLASPAVRGELLLADASEASVRVAAVTPAGRAGCDVSSPNACPAVRRGSVQNFTSSADLDACPHLPGREGGPCSAVCVPVTFLGRPLGVLHVVGDDGVPPPTRLVSALDHVAAEAGARIGTLRAFATSDLQATTDGLTGLPNRRSADERLRKMVRSGSPFAVGFADLDNFKVLNDTFGHETGDRALRHFARVAAASLREGDAIYRFGGEEFLVVFDGADVTTAAAVADRLRDAVATDATSGGAPPFTVSIGVAGSAHDSTPEILLEQADAALFAAKHNGRNRVEIAQAGTRDLSGALDSPRPA